MTNRLVGQNAPWALAGPARHGSGQRCPLTKEGRVVGLNWIKSKRSGPYSDNCAWVATDGEKVHVKDEYGNLLHLTREEWDAFLGGAKDGDFDAV